MAQRNAELWECLKCAEHFEGDAAAIRQRDAGGSLVAGLCLRCRPAFAEWVDECDRHGGIKRDGVHGQVIERVCTRCDVHFFASRLGVSIFCPQCCSKGDHAEWMAVQSAVKQERGTWLAWLFLVASVVLPIVVARWLPQGAVGAYSATATLWIVAGVGCWVWRRATDPRRRV